MYDGAIRKLKQDLKAYVDERLATLVKIRPYASSSADGNSDKVSGYPNDEQTYDYDAQRMWPFGLRSRPPTGTDSVWISVGGRNRSSNAVVVGAESSGYGPSDLAEGEVGIYNKVSGTLVKLDANGKISVTAAAGQVVEINGNTYALPQWDSFMTALNAMITTLTTVTNATASVVATAATTFQTAASGAANWKSTKAKNG